MSIDTMSDAEIDNEIDTIVGSMKRINKRELLLNLYASLYKLIREEEIRTIDLEGTTVKKDQITMSMEVTERGKFVADAVLLKEINDSLQNLTYSANTTLSDINDVAIAGRMGYVLEENDDLNFLPFYKDREGIRQYRGHCVYYCPEILAQRVKNCPVTSSFVVDTTRYVDINNTYYFGKQELYVFNSNTYEIYHRELHSVGREFRDTWNEWKRYMTTDNIRFGVLEPSNTNINGVPGTLYMKYNLNNTTD